MKYVNIGIGPKRGVECLNAPEQQISDPVFILFNKFLCEYLRTVNIANLTFHSKTGTIANSLTVLGGCKDGICNLIETYSKEKINNDLEFIDQSVISTQLDRRPTRRKTGTRLIEEFIVDAHIPSSVASNDKCDELRRTIVELKWVYGVVVSMFDFHRSDRGSNPGRGGKMVVAVKFHNVYDYTIERHPWQVSENHKPRVHPSHVREIG